MRKWASIFVVFSILTVACTAGDNVGTASTTVVDPPSSADSFCVTVERTRVDFGVANDLHLLLKLKSVFYDEDISADYVLNHTLEEMFGYLGVYSSNIPAWARDIVDKEIARAEASNSDLDFSVLNGVYNELVKDPAYSDLKEPSRLEEFVEVVFKGIIESLGDPFSSYMRAELWQTGFAENSGRYEGVGIGTKVNSRGEMEISFVKEGAPADLAGLKLGDAIVKVNGLSTKACTNEQFVLQVRGLKDPKLTLEIARGPVGSPEREILTIDVEKAIVKSVDLSTYPAVELPDNRGTTLEGFPYRCGKGGSGLDCPFTDVDGDGVPDTLYIKIHSFSDQMRIDLEYALQELDKQYGLDSFDGVVLDVRDNPGGLVSATMDVADFFLAEDDVIFIQKDKSQSGGEPVAVEKRQNKVTYIPESTPVVILMNDNSYSGAEVLSAALRDNGRAVIVNRSDRSGGKGTVNRWWTLKNGEYGAVYVSIGMWLTPTGEFIETRDEDNDGYDELGGLKPDIHVSWTDADYAQNNRDVNYDPTLSSALEWLAEELSK